MARPAPYVTNCCAVLHKRRNPGGMLESRRKLPRMDGIRVLVVEDDHDSRDFMADALTMAGAVTRVAASSEEGLELLTEFPPDIIVSDIGLPGEDGCQFMRRVRALDETRGARTPSIAHSAFSAERVQREAREAGFDRFVAKPVDLRLLLEAILSVLGRSAG